MRHGIQPALLLGAALASCALGACTQHVYALRVRGQAAPAANLALSYWAQEGVRAVPQQYVGPLSPADAAGSFEVVSTTTLDFDGPPPQLTLEVTGVGPLPLCVLLPTRGIWQAGPGERSVALPALRPLGAGELSYELSVAGLPAKVRVVGRALDARQCVQRSEKG